MNLEATTTIARLNRTAEYRLLRCCNLQRRSVVQRRPPRHFLEAWYFWLGIALLVVSVIFSVSIPTSSIKMHRACDSRSDFSNKRFRKIIFNMAVFLSARHELF